MGSLKSWRLKSGMKILFRRKRFYKCMNENEETVIDQIISVCIETSTWYWYNPKKTFTRSVLIRLDSSSASRSNIYLKKKHYSFTKNNRERRQTYFQNVYHLSGIALQERYDESFFNWYWTHIIIQKIYIYLASKFLYTWRWELSISWSDIVSLLLELFLKVFRLELNSDDVVHQFSDLLHHEIFYLMTTRLSLCITYSIHSRNRLCDRLDS